MAPSAEFSSWVEVLAVGLFECCSQGLDLVSVLRCV